MKLFYKLLLGFLIVASLSWVTGYFTLINSKDALENAFIANSEHLATELLSGIEAGIENKIEVFAAYTHDLLLMEAVEASNRSFGSIKDASAHIADIDREWTSAPKKDINPLMKGLMNNKLALELKEKERFYIDHYGYGVFGEIFVTNKYGANIAMTNKTTDYRQDDEEWWQIAQKEGSYLSGVNFDESADVYSIDFSVSIKDSNDQFAGVIKVVVNMVNIIEFINEVRENRRIRGMAPLDFKILDNTGKLIYSTRDYIFLEDASDLIPESHLNTDSLHPLVYSVQKRKLSGEKVYLSHVHSIGAKKLGWILVVEQTEAMLFAPVSDLRNRIIMVSLGITFIGIFIGYLISRRIAVSVNSLRDAAVIIGKGDLDTVIDIESNDEIGELADSINQMTHDLKSTTVARDDLIHEVEKREIIETELEISSNLLTTVLGGIEAVVYVADIKTYEVLYVNKYTKDMFGDIEGKTCWQVLQSDKKAPCDFCTNDKLLTPDGKPGNVYNWEFQNTSNGRWYDTRDRAIYWIDGRIARLEIATDITDRKRAEISLKESEEKLKSLYSSMTEGVCLHEIIYDDSGKAFDYKIIDVNPAYEKITGLSRERAVGSIASELYGTEQPPYCDIYEKVASSGEPVSFETFFPPMEKHFSISVFSPKKGEFATVFEDISERKQAEEALINAKNEIERWSGELEKRVQEKTEELEKSQIQLVQAEKLSAMGQLSAGLAHELNSPLAGLLPLLQKYKKTAESGSEAYGDMALMLRASEHMAKIVRDFGSFARKPGKERSELSIEDIIESTLSFSSGELEKKGVEIIKKYQGSLPKVLGNKTELQQVVLNIITNARDAMSDGGSFTIKTGIDGGKVKTEFTDNGVGINNNDIARVFDPFFTTKPQGMGIGLGLSISYGIIKNHGGDILVQSELKKGTTFTVLIPAAVSKGETKDG